MRQIEITSAFKRDFKKIKITPKHRGIQKLLSDILNFLISDTPLAHKYCDHALTGNWKDFRECHLKPDLLLIYQKTTLTLRLIRLGSHSELGF